MLNFYRNTSKIVSTIAHSSSTYKMNRLDGLINLYRNNLILLPTNKWFCLLDIGIQVVVLKGLQLSQQLNFVVRFREYPACLIDFKVCCIPFILVCTKGRQKKIA